MNKQCPECRKTFEEGTGGFEQVRLQGICMKCADETGPEDYRARLRASKKLDRKLKALADQVAVGVEANVTSGPQQVSLITIVRYGPCSVGDVARIVGLDQSSITLQLKKFLKEGLVGTTSGADKRCKIVEATMKAKDLFSQ